MTTKENTKSIRRLTKMLVFMTTIVFLLLGVIAILLVKENKEEEEAKGFCGVVDYIDSEQSPTSSPMRVAMVLNREFNNEEGKKLFKSYCASCHANNTKMLVGPGMANLFDRIPDVDWLNSFLIDSDSTLTLPYSYNKSLLSNSNRNTEWNHSLAPLTEQQRNDVIGYLGTLSEL